MKIVNIFAKNIEQSAFEQIESISKSPAIDGNIAIMPDAHAGAGCVIGFTGRYSNFIIPNIVGVDIGCGVTLFSIGKREKIDFGKLDKFVRLHIPSGFASRAAYNEIKDFVPQALFGEIMEFCKELNTTFYKALEIKENVLTEKQIGTLGGGNHFLEIAVERNSKGVENVFLAVHSGSRNFGNKMAQIFQNKAKKYCKDNSITTPNGLEYMPIDSSDGKKYLSLVFAAQQYAQYNRLVMLHIMAKFFEVEINRHSIIESVHNFIDSKDKIIRKGAIKAYKNEKVVIPLNMAKGIIIGKGKGNAEYNFSAPHGAGRVAGRNEMMRKLKAGEVTIGDFKKAMEGVFSTCLSNKTIDESPFAYKTFEDIKEHLEQTVEVDEILSPVYNFKAG